jgi:hypothetical protein
MVGEECGLPVIHLVAGFTLRGESVLYVAWIHRGQIRLLMAVDTLDPFEHKISRHGILVTALAVNKIVCAHEREPGIRVDFLNLEDLPAGLVVAPLAVTAKFRFMDILMTRNACRFHPGEVLDVVTGLAIDQRVPLFQRKRRPVVVEVDLGPGVGTVTVPTVHCHILVRTILSVYCRKTQVKDE